MKNKILNKKKLKQILSKHHNLGKKIVHCHGVFDVLHLGHFEHFSKALRLLLDIPKREWELF